MLDCYYFVPARPTAPPTNTENKRGVYNWIAPLAVKSVPHWVYEYGLTSYINIFPLPTAQLYHWQCQNMAPGHNHRTQSQVGIS